MKKRRVPLRKCINCGADKPKEELIRIVRTAENRVKIDKTGRINGRGAYICLSNKCLEDVIKSNKISKTLKLEIDKSIYTDLEKEIE